MSTSNSRAISRPMLGFINAELNNPNRRPTPTTLNPRELRISLETSSDYLLRSQKLFRQMSSRYRTDLCPFYLRESSQLPRHCRGITRQHNEFLATSAQYLMRYAVSMAVTLLVALERRATEKDMKMRGFLIKVLEDESVEDRIAALALTGYWILHP
ncbi:uncharacterized protein H6S33_003821 [Morchella sextelata]|uniref:uncharacterized protein n=1 Tax=Morchella sextelata TaxID=1174677 RepID=UPI001D04D373|nr:uncharacterized protein H6S33_003821 [Morchella sextelata]KAH0606160.1 hypothetical protein H6S33_003821 [Morchella sextelata]